MKCFFFVFRYEIAGCEVIWVFKDETIGNRFLDEGAAAFFLKHLNPNLPDNATHKPQPGPAKKQRYVAWQANKRYDQEAQGIPSQYIFSNYRAVLIITNMVLMPAVMASS